MPRKGSPVNASRANAAANMAAHAKATDGTPKPDASKEQPRSAGAKVVIGCKLPNGMILRLFEMKERQEPVLGGGMRVFKQSEPIPGQRIRVNGTASPYGSLPNYTIRNGCAFTKNVDRDFWVKWLDQNKDHTAVVEKMIFAEDDEPDAIAVSSEQKEALSGMHPMIPDKDKRVPKTPNPNLTGVETEDERKAKLVAA